MMYSLLLKDFYILFNNLKAFVLMILVFAVAFIPSSGALSFIVASGVMSGMMVITTFSYDERSKWHRFALIMPLRRNQIVLSKFLLLTGCAFGGLILASAISLMATLLARLLHLDLAMSLQAYLPALLVGFSLAIVYGSVSIPLLFKYGAEKARILMILSFLLPSAVGYLLYQGFGLLGIALTEALIYGLILTSPLLALLWSLPFYVVSLRIFKQQEAQ